MRSRRRGSGVAAAARCVAGKRSSARRIHEGLCAEGLSSTGSDRGPTRFVGATSWRERRRPAWTTPRRTVQGARWYLRRPLATASIDRLFRTGPRWERDRPRSERRPTIAERRQPPAARAANAPSAMRSTSWWRIANAARHRAELRDAKRVAGANPPLWRDSVLANRERSTPRSRRWSLAASRHATCERRTPKRSSAPSAARADRRHDCSIGCRRAVGRRGAGRGPEPPGIVAHWRCVGRPASTS